MSSSCPTHADDGCTCATNYHPPKRMSVANEITAIIFAGIVISFAAYVGLSRAEASYQIGERV